MTARVTALDNGLRVATQAMDSVESASLGVWVGAGTRDEEPEINGAAHLLEHIQREPRVNWDRHLGRADTGKPSCRHTVTMTRRRPGGARLATPPASAQ